METPAISVKKVLKILNKRRTKLLGKGTYGKVFLAEYKKTKYALKVDCTSQMRGHYYREVVFLERLGGAGGAPTPIRFCPLIPAFLMSLSKGYNLEDYLSDAKEDVDLLFLYNVAIRVTERLAEIHRKGVVHCDLKADNVMFSVDGDGKLEEVYIIDFSCACFVGQCQPVEYLVNNLP
ncbi:uncharacterized protein LOC134771912 [Penaeus indicus]|uniref:uncharacterized protein LOC134771912 n=1 Tax=Penaeus indicus TaxID=29960 RepID=UPI00300DB925